MANDKEVEELRKQVKKLQNELKTVKDNQNTSENTKDKSKKKYLEEKKESSSNLSRRKFLKGALGGAAGIGAAIMLPSASAFTFKDDSSFKFGNLSSSQNNVEIKTNGNLDMYRNNIHNVNSISAEKVNNDFVVESASEMNEALTEIAAREGEGGGRIKWRAGFYTGESFTEPVEIPSDAGRIILDMRNVEIEIDNQSPYFGEDGYFFYKPPASNSSTPIDIYGPEPLRILGDLPSGCNVMELYDTDMCEIRPWIIATFSERCLFLRQSTTDVGSGHHVRTEGTKLYGGRVSFQVGSTQDSTGKDRSHYGAQIGGWREAGFLLEGKSLHNFIDIQNEGPIGNGDEKADNSGVRIRSDQNTLRINHIGGEHPLDIQAKNIGIRTPGIDGNPEPWQNSRLGVQPTDIETPGYESQSFDFSSDWRPVLRTDTSSDSSASVNYNSQKGAAELAIDSWDEHAALYTGGAAGQMDHHVHAYANIEINNRDGKQMLFGPRIDQDNYAMVGMDATKESADTNTPLTVEIYSGGTELVNEVIGDYPLTRPQGWICYVRDGYQAFFYQYDLIWEGYKDLTGWSQEPEVGVWVSRGGTGSHTTHVHRLETGLGKRWEAAP